MTALALWLKSKLFGSSSGILIMILLGVIAFIVIPNLDAIKEKLGIETRASLKVKVEQQNAVIDTLESSNANLAESIAIIDQVHVVKEEAVAAQVEVKQVVQEEVKVVVKAKAKKVKMIKASHHTPEQQTNEISHVQIKTIWDQYCSFNQHQQCGVTA